MVLFWVPINCNKSFVAVYLLTDLHIEDSFLNLFVATRIAQDVVEIVVADKLILLEKN